MTIPWLTVLWLIPAIASVAIILLPAAAAETAKRLGLGAAAVTAVWAIVVATRFSTSGGGDRFQLVEDVSWIPAIGARYSLALDGIGLALILLTTCLTPLLLLAGWRDADSRRGGESPRAVHAYAALLLAIEAMVLISFVATDVLLFYLVFEAMLIPMYFLIGGYGTNASRAAVKFLLYNLLGGLIMLAAVIGLYVVTTRTGPGTFSFTEISAAAQRGELDASSTTMNLLFLGFLFAFAVKAPLWPLHSWLPDSAVAATPSAAVMMMAVMDKVGTFAMLRFCLGLFPDASERFAPFVSALAVVSILYGAILAIGQTDVMRLIAYTSISHFGFIVLGVFAMTSQGLAGSTLYMVNHGISTAALFLVAGFLVTQRGSRMIADYGGLQKVVPVLAGTFLVAGLATLSLPGLAPFVSEFLVLIGTYVRYPAAAVLAALALVASALYILWTYQRMFGGPVREPEVAGQALSPDESKAATKDRVGGRVGATKDRVGGRVGATKDRVGGRVGATKEPRIETPLRDLSLRQRIVVAPLIAALLVLGFFPGLILDFVDPAVGRTMTSIGRTDPPAVAGGER